MNDYQKFMAISRYSRWIEEENRRETWEETVLRWYTFWVNRYPDLASEIAEASAAILALEVMPSMRSLMTAGEALERDEIAGYNCSYVPIDHPRAFDEIMYILMCGTGVGFSVEREYVNKLPLISEEFHDTETIINVPDSRMGWASSFRELISLLYSGRIPKWDTSKLRPAGSKLRVFGGRSSGPEPLEELFRYSVGLFKKACGRRLTTLECHDLVCKIAEVVVVGGVRRSALISLSNLTDDRLRNAKTGAWWETNVHRSLANNSVAYTEKPDMDSFLKECYALYSSKSGERGFFNRVSAIEKRKRALEHRSLDTSRCWEYGTNPCGEILLRPYGLCNLTESVIRPEDTLSDIRRKVRIASFIGTLQSTLTNFRYLRSVWKHNSEEERLLGVSLTGIMDHPVFSNRRTPADVWTKEKGDPTYVGVRLGNILKELKEAAIDTNRQFADKLGISASNAVTCIKPSGTVSQLVGSSSGIHPSYSRYYIRTVRQDIKDPLTQFLISEGVPNEVDVTNPNNIVFSFPMEAPETSVTSDEISALEQLRLYKTYSEHWCEHNPSITVYYNDDEFTGVCDWIYRNWDDYIGISFLPKSDHVYKQAPYQPISREEYEEKSGRFPKINWSRLSEFEVEDTTTSSHELACVSGVCEI